ncbi:multicopper oxidase domain-containing protein [Jiangella alkaliphila]|uniref:Multicopper oxidase n=1 Tax=Jiangella alkaliphila TaxID=419479 RepID=A0A1H2K211_9ACTN|nr:multicopper oxidase domain-containing protein [Jiangella alkaliphila]SDU62458.1 Multicopper oxidase [Jiangella alkaliphila]
MADNPVRRGWLGHLTRRSVLAGAVASAAFPAVAATTSAATASPRSAAVPGMRTAQATGTTRRVTIYAEALPGGLFGYGLAPGEATIPGPLLEIVEGDTLEIELVNTTNQRLSIHPHGVDYDVFSDGAPFNDSFNEPGETRTYVWRSRERSTGGGRVWLPGTAGYWHYHDHALGGDHGTQGLQKGLYGGLIVRRKGDLLPDKTFVVVFNDMTINNKMAPEAPMFDSNLGERVEWLCIGHGSMEHTFHLHAHRWADTRTGYLDGPNDLTQAVDNKDLNPGSSFGFQVIAGEGVGAGAWMYHCHVQFHSDGGMAGIFLVRNEDGSIPDHAQEAIDRYHAHHGGLGDHSGHAG